jgi:hypothetical protein
MNICRHMAEPAPNNRLVYRIRYALHLCRHVPGMTFLEAWRYPRPFLVSDGDPVEDAEAEIDAMRD